MTTCCSAHRVREERRHGRERNQFVFKVRRMPPSRRSRRPSRCCSRSRSKTVNRGQREGQDQALRPDPRSPRTDWKKAYVRGQEGQDIDFLNQIAGQGTDKIMAIIKAKPTSPAAATSSRSRREGPAQGCKPHAPLLEKKIEVGRPQQQRPDHHPSPGGGHKQRYRIIDFKRDKDGIPGQGRAHRVRSEPQRAHRADQVRGRRAPLHHCAEGPRVGDENRQSVKTRRSRRR